jgi:hypothetical protein
LAAGNRPANKTEEARNMVKSIKYIADYVVVFGMGVIILCIAAYESLFEEGL